MLPKIEHPLFEIQVPSIKKKYKFRPMLVKEEKILLMAKESNNENDIFLAINQVLNNCCVDKLDMSKLAIFDLEYIFIKLRSVSIDNKVYVNYRDPEDQKVYNFEVNLNDVEVVYPDKKINNIVKINDVSGLILKYPSASLYNDKEFLESEEDQYFKLILRCIDKVYFGDEVFECNEESLKDLEEFVENLRTQNLNEINEFLTNTPKLNYVIKYKNESGTEKELRLNSLNDFFIWR